MSDQTSNKPFKGTNLVALSDGTGNEVEKKLSNVLKLFRFAEKDENQRIFYDPGIGTVGSFSRWGRLRSKVGATFSLATGLGLDKNIVNLYRWLCENWQEGDRIWLFGYSRGAYTVRAVAGLIRVVGILRPDQSTLAEFAVKAYKTAGYTGDWSVVDNFKRVTGSRTATIHFVGVWDTVASVIVPGWRKLVPFQLEYLPYTDKNPSVRHFRQALAIDEKRRMFRPRIWDDPQTFEANPYVREKDEPQTIRQVWFAGEHGDVGGGHAEADSGLAKFPLIWMAEEAKAEGLNIRTQSFNWIAKGQNRANSTQEFSKPAAVAKLHRSLSGGWLLPEILPKRNKQSDNPKRKESWGIYLPLGEKRFIEDGALIHDSVIERAGNDANYRPKNIPKTFRLWSDPTTIVSKKDFFPDEGSS